MEAFDSDVAPFDASHPAARAHDPPARGRPKPGVVSSRGIGWPDRERWRAYLTFLLVFDALFFAVYIGAGRIAASSDRAVGLYFDRERDIPLVPWMIVPYLSLYTMFLLPLPHLTPAEMRRLTQQSVLMLLIAGFSFLLIPAHLGFAPEPVTGTLRPIFDVMIAIDTPFNLVPSLHVAFAALLIIACGERASRPVAWLYGVWLAIASASTIFVHQHHLVDVVAGLGLAVLARRAITPSRCASPGRV